MWHSIELTVFNVACFLSVSRSHLEFLGGGGMLLLSPERSGPCGHLLLSLASSWRCSVVSVTEGAYISAVPTLSLSPLRPTGQQQSGHETLQLIGGTAST